MMRLAHELAQNGAEAITFFSTMVPDQALSNSDTLSYFRSAASYALPVHPRS